jgi:hypothetical protein
MAGTSGNVTGSQTEKQILEAEKFDSPAINAIEQTANAEWESKGIVDSQMTALTLAVRLIRGDIYHAYHAYKHYSDLPLEVTVPADEARARLLAAVRTTTPERDVKEKAVRANGNPPAHPASRTVEVVRLEVPPPEPTVVEVVRLDEVVETAATSPQSGFDYEALNSGTRTVVQQKTGEIRCLMRRAAQDIVDIGLKLLEVKEQLPHGQWLPWLAREFPQWGERSARNFMSVATTFKSATVADLPIAQRALYLLASPSTPPAARNEAIAVARRGEEVTHAKAREIVESHMPATVVEPSGPEPEAEESGPPIVPPTPKAPQKNTGTATRPTKPKHQAAVAPTSPSAPIEEKKQDDTPELMGKAMAFAEAFLAYGKKAQELAWDALRRKFGFVDEQPLKQKDVIAALVAMDAGEFRTTLQEAVLLRKEQHKALLPGNTPPHDVGLN